MMHPAAPVPSGRQGSPLLHRLQREDDGVAMVTALIAIMLAAALSILMLAMITTQVLPTAYLQESSSTIFAAEAGVNAVVGQIRNAAAPPDATNTIYGDTHKLPCTAEGPVDAATSTLRYSATVRYYLADPTGRSDTWLAANALSCVPGSGPAKDPAYALIVSDGIGDPVRGMPSSNTTRTVQVVYEFQITNNNIPGGLIYDFDVDTAKAEKFCLQADSVTAGSYVRYVPAADCGTDDVRQLWIYDTTYQIKLASSTIPAYSTTPLCITGPTGATLPEKTKLQPCKAPTDAARWNQLFSWEGGANFRGQQSTISNGYANIWLSTGNTGAVTSGAYLQAWNTDGDRKEWVSFNPDARVGAGAAGYATHQIVNYLEFGRCFDVTGENVNSTYMIVYPCKQDPIPGSPNLLWNHKWYYNEPAAGTPSSGPQQIYVKQYNSTKYCLQSPGTEGGYVTLTSACNTSLKSQQWTRYYDTGNYATSYTIMDGWGRCVSLGDKFDAWSKITVATCNSGLGQKWNAPPNTITASLEGYQELP